MVVVAGVVWVVCSEVVDPVVDVEVASDVGLVEVGLSVVSLTTPLPTVVCCVEPLVVATSV